MKLRTTTDTSTVDTNSTDHTLPTIVSVQQAGVDHTCSHYSDASAVFSILPHCHISIYTACGHTEEPRSYSRQTGSECSSNWVGQILNNVLIRQ